MFPTNSERLIGIFDAFSAFVYGYLSSCPRAHCTPNKSVPTLCYTRRHGPVYTGHACRHLPSAVPWISEDRLLLAHLRTPTAPVRIWLLTFSWHLTQLCWSVRLNWLWLPGKRIYPRWRRSAFCFIHLYHSCRISRHKLTLLTHPLPPVCQ